MYTLENTKNMILHTDYKSSLLKDINILLVGENHSNGHILAKKLIQDFKPDFYLTEHIQYLNVMNKEEFEERLANLGKDGLPYNMFTRKFLEMGKNLGVPFIGCDYIPPDDGRDRKKDFEYTVYEMDLEESFKIREADMLKIIKKYANKGKVLASIGDTHFRGKVSDDFGPLSPLTEHYANREEALIMRLPVGYKQD